MTLRRRWFGGVAVLLALTACAETVPPDQPPSAAPDASTPGATVTSAVPTTAASSTTSSGAYEQIEFTSRAGTTRSGRLFGDGEVAVVLSHMGRPRDDQDDWEPFATELAAKGYRVLTYSHENVEVWQDVLGAVDYLRASGAETVIAGGASLGAMASLSAAEQPDAQIDGVIWLAGVLHNSGYDFFEADVSQVACPLLVVSADQDAAGAADDARQLDAWSSTSELHIIPSRDHGTDILAEGGEPADQLRLVLLAFVDRVAAGSTTC